MSYIEALESAISIAKDKYFEEVEPLHVTNVFTHSLMENLPPDSAKTAFVDTLLRHKRARGADLTDKNRWQTVPWSRQRINSLDLFSLSINFTDMNHIPIPTYLIPPRGLIRKYYEMVEESDHPLRLDEQFDKALTLVGVYPTAACIFLMIATRACARGQDRKILGRQIPDHITIEKFRHNIAGYDKQWVENEPPDPLGNTYYVFTNAGMNMLLRANGIRKIHEDALSFATFPLGTRSMKLFRKYLAKQPQWVSHKIPAKFGLEVGTHLAHEFLSRQK